MPFILISSSFFFSFWLFNSLVPERPPFPIIMRITAVYSIPNIVRIVVVDTNPISHDAIMETTAILTMSGIKRTMAILTIIGNDDSSETRELNNKNEKNEEKIGMKGIFLNSRFVWSISMGRILKRKREGKWCFCSHVQGVLSSGMEEIFWT